MENDTQNAGTVELVSSEVSGYLDANGQFQPGTPPAAETDEAVAFVQSDEDVIEG